MMYGELYNIMSPQEFRAKYSQAECKELDATLDRLEANQPCELSEIQINRLDEFVRDLAKVQQYQHEQAEATFLKLFP